MRRDAWTPVVLALISTAACATTTSRSPPPEVAAATRPRAPEPEVEGAPVEYRLDRLPVLSRVLLHVVDSYVDPSRIRPRNMVVAALERVATVVDDLELHGDASSRTLTLTKGGSSVELELEQVDSIWKVRTQLGRAMVFVEPKLEPGRDPRDVEFAAVQGFLSTLDEQSVLLTPRIHREVQSQSRGDQGRAIAAERLLESGVAYVRLAQLTPGVVWELRASIDGQRRLAGGKLRGLVLDLRGCPGGLLADAAALADVFLSKGEIVTIETSAARRPRVLERKQATRTRDDLGDLPLIVLVDGATFAGAEAVAAALEDNERALVMGSRTRGKGSIQVAADLSEKGRGDRLTLMLTIARMRRPGGALIEEGGVTPDVMLKPDCPLQEDAAAAANGGAGGSAIEVRAAATEAAAAELSYVPPAGCESRELASDEAVRFAREVLDRAASAKRSKLLDVARTLAAPRVGR